jgi:hypothetical protein
MKSQDRNQQQGVAQLPPSYAAVLEDIKKHIRTAQFRAASASSRELIELYRYIGRSIVERQKVEGWGRSIVERLASDLQKTSPGMAGFSSLNVWRMRAFYLAWTEDLQKLSQPVTESEAKKLSRLSAVDDRLRHADDKPTIGILLCKEKDKITVEYALRDMSREYGIAMADIARQLGVCTSAIAKAIRKKEGEDQRC